jgi:hypothetical protein
MKAIHSVHGIRARDSGRQCVPNKLFISFLFNDPDVGVQLAQLPIKNGNE